MTVILTIVLAVIIVVVLAKRHKQKSSKREAYIRSFAFPQGILRKVHAKTRPPESKRLGAGQPWATPFFSRLSKVRLSVHLDAIASRRRPVA